EEKALETNVKAIELKDLWRRFKGGDDRARERLVVAYSPLVKYVAGRMSSGLPAHVEEADLISYGLIGLISAIERFDLSRELKVEEFQESLLQISNSTIAALDELWTVSDASGDQVSLLDTIQDPDAPDPERIIDASELKDRVADAIARLPEREKLVIALYYYE